MSISKICTKCKINKPKKDYRKDKSQKSGIHPSCKLCEYKSKLLYRRSRVGLCHGIYDSQVNSSKRRGHDLPSYSKDEIREWILSQHSFNNLFNVWVAGGFNREQIPSVDRLDDDKPYSMDNIRLTDWITNKSKMHTDMIKGVYTSTLKIVLQYDKKMNLINEFFSMSEAHRVTGASISKISLVCNGIRKSHYGFIWKFKDEG